MVLSVGEAKREVRGGGSVISGTAALCLPPACPSPPPWEWRGGCQRKGVDQLSTPVPPPTYRKDQAPTSSPLLLLRTSAVLHPSPIPRPDCPKVGGEGGLQPVPPISRPTASLLA